MSRTARALAAGALLFAAACTRPPPQPAPIARTEPVAAAAGACLILTEPVAENALVVNAGAQVVAPRCEIHVVSTAKPAVTLNADSTLELANLCVAGDISRHGGLIDHPSRGCAAAIDPAMMQTSPPIARLACDERPHAVNGGVTVLQPGVYCGGLAFNGAPRVSFAPGFYVIRGGDWTFNGGDYAGEGVTFYFADASKPVFNSGVAVRLSAPATGARAGVLMDEASDLAPSTLTFNDARRMVLDGLVHLPSRKVVFNAGSRLDGSDFTGVFTTAVLNGTTWTLRGPARMGAGA